MKIVIIDYKMGNLGSISNMLKKIGVPSIISDDKGVIAEADKLILPGVGAFDNGMRNIDLQGLRPILDKKVMQEGTPVLGICLGMQLITKRSEEGELPGLGWVDAHTVKFLFKPEQGPLKIPHMGWNSVTIKKKNSLFLDMPDTPRFYFVHSYYVHCQHPEDVLTETTHGFSFASSFQHTNIAGVQFHPEKSHKYGMKLLSNFVSGKLC